MRSPRLSILAFSPLLLLAACDGTTPDQFVGISGQSTIIAATPAPTATPTPGPTGTPVPDVQVSPSSWDFGLISTGNNSIKTLIVSNSNPEAATFGAATILGSGYSITADGCNGQTKASSSGTCNISVKYEPSVPGSSLGQLTLNYTWGSSGVGTKTVTLSGIGDMPQPALTLSPNPFNFGNVATNSFANQIITVSNNTSVNATVGTASISGAGFTIVANTCNLTVLTPAANCQITARFTPAGTGAVGGTLTVPYTSAQGISYTATSTLGGTGITPSVAFSFNGFTGNAATDTTNLTASGVTLQWTAQTSASYYRVTRSGGTTVVTGNLAPTSVATYNVSGLAPNTTYQFKVNAYDSSDVSDGNNNWVSVTTPNVTAATFNGWSDVVALGSVYTDVGLLDTAAGYAGTNRLERNLAHVIGFDNTAINTGTGEITFSNIYTIPTGTSLTYRTSGTAAAPLVSGTQYYAINTGATTIKLAASHADALAGTAIPLTGVGTGNMTLMPGAVVKLGWDAFTISPSGTASSFNIYRSATSGGTYSLVGTSATNSFSDYTVTDNTTYYYKVHPVVSAVEVLAAAVDDSEIQVRVPPQNMALLHRWIVNREACTTLLGATWPSGINRSSHYSCAYTWGGGYAPNTTRDKTRWDLGYSLIMDRYQSGCKVGAWAGSFGATAPAAGLGSSGAVYYTIGPNTVLYPGAMRCYIKDSGAGWVTETNFSVGQRPHFLSTRSNAPGFPPAGITQSQAYAACQQRVVAGASDGNGNTALRLMMHHEGTLARAVQGINVNNRNAGVLNTIFSSVNLPTNGSCQQPKFNSGGVYLEGVNMASDPSNFSKVNSHLINGTQLSRNCTSRYDISDLWNYQLEWTSTQYYQTGAGAGYFIASALNSKDNLLENFAMNGTTMGITTNHNNLTYFFGSANTATYANNNVLPLFGIRAQGAASTVLGTRLMNFSVMDYGNVATNMAIYMGIGGYTLWGVTLGSRLSYASASRYNFGMAEPSIPYETQQTSQTANYRCVGEVGP